jgi:bacterioferritin-associated ferredoxin
MSSSVFRDASEGAEMRNHLVRERPLGHADMSRMELIMFAAGWSAAFVAIVIRLIGIG